MINIMHQFKQQHGRVSSHSSERSRSHQTIRISWFTAALALVLFSVPFGQWQSNAIDGLTIAKLVIPTLFLLLLATRMGNVALHPHLWVVVGFVLGTTPSLLSSENYSSIVFNLIGYIVLFFLIYNVIGRMRDLHMIFLGYGIGLSIISVFTIFALIFGADLGATLGRPLVEKWYGLPILLGTENNPNAFATFYVAGAPIVLFLHQIENSRVAKIFYGLMYFLFLVIVALTFSRSGIAGVLLASFLIMHFARSHHPRMSHSLCVTIVFGVIVSAVLAISFFLLEQLDSHVAGWRIFSNKDLSQSYRLQFLKQFLPIITEHPLTGIGYGNIPPLMEKLTGLRNNSHNAIFCVIIEYGLVAGVFFIAVIGLSLRSLLKGVSVAETRVDKLTGALILAVISGLLVHGMFHDIYINFTLWLFLGLGGVYRAILQNDYI